MRTATTCSSALILVLTGCGPLEREVPWRSLDLGIGSLEVRYQEPLGPAAFAAQRVRFCFRGADGERLLAETWLHNDGALPGENNLEFRDQGNGSWQLVSNGDEQAAERWPVHTAGGAARMEKLE